MIAFFTLCIPPLILTYIRNKLIGISHSKKSKLFLNYLMSTIILNWALMLILLLIFHNTSDLPHEINSSKNFSFKYILLAICVSFAEPFVEKYIRNHISSRKREQFSDTSIPITKKTRHIATIIIISACIVTGIGLNLYQYFNFSIYKKIDITEITSADTKKYAWKIDTLIEQVDIYQIDGWIVRKKEDITSSHINLIIANTDGSCFLVPTTMKTRMDVTTSLNSNSSDYNYDASGFSTAINKHYVHSPNSKIYILYRNNNRYEIIDISTNFENN